MTDIHDTTRPETFAIVRGTALSLETIAAYMPANYQALAEGADSDGPWVLIAGQDDAGWTMTDYVRPRLMSGLYSCVVLRPATEKDSSILDTITSVLDRAEWDATTPESIADLIRLTGRQVRDPEDTP